jgi:hypothetical protein
LRLSPVTLQNYTTQGKSDPVSIVPVLAKMLPTYPTEA